MSCGQSRSLGLPSLLMGRNTCCPTVRYGSIRAVYRWMCIKGPCPVKLLSIFFILPTLVSTIEFLRSPRLISPLQPLTEHGLAAEVRYFFTGKELDPPIRNTHLPFNVVSHPGKPTVSKPCDQMVVSVPATRQPPYSPESDDTVRKWFGA